MKRPILVAIDSANNCGKSTIIEYLEMNLLMNDIKVEVYRQPYLECNRNILLSGGLTYKQEYPIFKKDRNMLHVSKIDKSTADVILLDRFVCSSLVYQSIRYDDYRMQIEIIKDISKLYNTLGYKIDIGVNLTANPYTISERLSDNTTEYDYRDEDDIDTIRDELDDYIEAWSSVISLGIIKDFKTYSNNEVDDIFRIATHLTANILELIKKE
jgi:thymidylate kinase